MSAAEDGKGMSAASGFKVSQIDHVHVYVADRRAAARWYADVLGLEVCHEIEGEDDGVPLVFRATAATPASRSSNAPDASPRADRRFRVARGLPRIPRPSRSLRVEGGTGGRSPFRLVAPTTVLLYFNDPDGNPYELTTYDYDDVRARLGSAA